MPTNRRRMLRPRKISTALDASVVDFLLYGPGVQTPPASHGQPMLASAVTPFKGIQSQSHFVALAERAP
jgi:hypothetical protein